LGKLKHGSWDWAVKLGLDTGLRGSPKLSLSIWNGGLGPSGVEWSVCNYLEDDRMLNDLQIVRVADHPKNLETSHPHVVTQYYDHDKQKLVCISFGIGFVAPGDIVDFERRYLSFMMEGFKSPQHPFA